MTGLAALVLAAAAATSTERAAQWHDLVAAKKLDVAKVLCRGWLASPEKDVQAEAHKCLAGLAMGAGGVDAALAELEAAIALLPADLAAHEARLQIAEGARRFSELPKFL